MTTIYPPYTSVYGEEYGKAVIHTPSHTIGIEYSPTNVIIIRDGRQFEVNRLPLHSQPDPVPIVKSPNDLAAESSAIKTAALWGMMGVVLLFIASIAGSFAYKPSASKFSQIVFIVSAYAGMAAILYSSYLFIRHDSFSR